MFRQLIFFGVFLAVFSFAAFSQDWESILDGKYEDFRRIPKQSHKEKEFTFARLIYNGRILGYLKNWYTDYPNGDKTLVQVVRRLTNINTSDEYRAIPINHPDLFKYPFVYSVEGGQIVLDEKDAEIMREYLRRGGFWMIDDFWGTHEWGNFESQMKKVFPDRNIVEIPLSHGVFHSFFDIEEKMQVPNIGYAYNPGTPTWEEDGYEPSVRGIFDEKGRLMVIMYFNTDTMDALEWADDPLYPNKFSIYAYKIFVNTIMYAMTH